MTHVLFKRITLPLILCAFALTSSAQQPEKQWLDVLTGAQQRQWIGSHTVETLGSKCNPDDVRYTFFRKTMKVVVSTCVNGVLTNSVPKPFTVSVSGTTRTVTFGGKTYTATDLPPDHAECNGHEECLRLRHRDARTGVTTDIYVYL